MTGEIPASRQIGEMAEQWAADEFGWWVDHASHYDCETPAGDVVEVKSCQRWVSSGDGRERGRFRLWKDSHERLVDDGGDYLFVVTERDGDTLYPEQHRRLDAGELDAVVQWQDNTYRQSKGPTGLLSWPYLFECEQSKIQQL